MFSSSPCGFYECPSAGIDVKNIYVFFSVAHEIVFCFSSFQNSLASFFSRPSPDGLIHLLTRLIHFYKDQSWQKNRFPPLNSLKELGSVFITPLGDSNRDSSCRILAEQAEAEDIFSCCVIIETKRPFNCSSSYSVQGCLKVITGMLNCHVCTVLISPAESSANALPPFKRVSNFTFYKSVKLIFGIFLNKSPLMPWGVILKLIALLFSTANIFIHLRKVSEEELNCAVKSGCGQF